MTIWEESQIVAEAEKYQGLVLYGKSSLVNILCRYFSARQIEVQKVSYADYQEKSGSFCKSQVESIEKIGQENRDFLVFALYDHHDREQTELAKKLLAESGCKNIAYVDYELMAELGAREHAHLDFVCAGFVKCGTSSLHRALKKRKKIFLPKKKETLYMNWRLKTEDAPERFNTIYFSDVKEGQITGDIEPSYHDNADGIYECFGKDTKLLFVVRNPADAAYSYFKMLMRKTLDKRQVNYYRRYFRYHVKMFDDYIQDYIVTEENARFKYINYIRRYEEYFGKSHIKVIFFEELIRDTEQVMDDVQKFIGIKPKKISSLPHSNEGKMVSRNYISAWINRFLYYKDVELRSVYSQKEKERHEKWKAFLHKYTLVENEEKMNPSSRAFLDEFYKDSIHELEDYCGKSLEGLWY